MEKQIMILILIFSILVIVWLSKSKDKYNKKPDEIIKDIQKNEQHLKGTEKIQEEEETRHRSKERLKENEKSENERKYIQEQEEERKKRIEERIQERKRLEQVYKQIKIENDQILDRYGIKYFYHITHRENLRGIIQKGLFSRNWLKESISNVTEISNVDVVKIREEKNDPINHYSISEYVPLYFNPKNPMLYNNKNIEKDIVIIEVDRSVLYLHGSIFTDGNAANRETRFFKDLKDLNELNWDCLEADYWNDFPDGIRERMAEVLVSDQIPGKYLKKLYCISNDTLAYVKPLLIWDINIEINEKYFFSHYKGKVEGVKREYINDDLPF